VFSSASSIVSFVSSSAVGVVCAVGYLMLFKRSADRTFRSAGAFHLAQTVSGLFTRLILTGLALFFISKIPSINFFVVLINFVVLVPVLFLWIARSFSKQTVIANDPCTTPQIKLTQ
jgi:hypothetical protein